MIDFRETAQIAKELDEKFYSHMIENNFVYMHPFYVCNVGLVEASMFGRALRLSFIKVNEENRREGWGGVMLGVLKRFADEHNIAITMNVDASFGVDRDALIAFYEKNGFVMTPAVWEEDYMVYEKKGEENDESI